MMRLPKFEFLEPDSIQNTVDLLARHGSDAKLLAGGTDLIVSMKQKLFTPKFVIGLGRVMELNAIQLDDQSGLILGAAVTWDVVQAHAAINRHYPALLEAAAAVATPTLQGMGTVGGNVCLDTRCYFYNQSHFWRKALGWCMKKGSDYCHVAPGLGKCVAVFSSDPVPALIAYDATLILAGPHGRKEMPLLDFYRDDGMKFNILKADEMVVAVKLPLPAKGTRACHQKMRKRQSIDYPIANVAVRVTAGAKGRVAEARIVLGAVASCPIRALDAEKCLVAQGLTTSGIDAAAQAAYQAIHPLPNTAGTPVYRRKVARVLVRRALTKLVEI